MLEKLFKTSLLELKRLLLYKLNPYRNNSKFEKTLFISFLIMSLVFIIIYISIIIRGIWIDPTQLNNTYATGTRYSTIKIKDFSKD
jgi:hypothetical protein